jgi:hypothetical protein
MAWDWTSQEQGTKDLLTAWSKLLTAKTFWSCLITLDSPDLDDLVNSTTREGLRIRSYFAGNAPGLDFGLLCPLSFSTLGCTHSQSMDQRQPLEEIVAVRPGADVLQIRL